MTRSGIERRRQLRPEAVAGVIGDPFNRLVAVEAGPVDQWRPVQDDLPGQLDDEILALAHAPTLTPAERSQQVREIH
jgi:hypothetical protein